MEIVHNCKRTFYGKYAIFQFKAFSTFLWLHSLYPRYHFIKILMPSSIRKYHQSGANQRKRSLNKFYRCPFWLQKVIQSQFFPLLSTVIANLLLIQVKYRYQCFSEHLLLRVAAVCRTCWTWLVNTPSTSNTLSFYRSATSLGGEPILNNKYREEE